MSTDEQVAGELREALQRWAVAEPVDLPALAAQVRTQTGARKRRRVIAGSAVAVCLLLAFAAVVPRLSGRVVTTAAAAACPAPVPAGYRRIATGRGGLTGVIPPGWGQDVPSTTDPVVRGSLQVSRPMIDAFITYRYDAEPGIATLQDFEDTGEPGSRLLRTAPVPYGTAQQASDTDYLISFSAARVLRRDWWIDGRIYSIFFVAPPSRWTELAPVRQAVLDASRPC